MASPLSPLQCLPRFLYSQLFVRIPPPTGDFSGQVFIVTGSNTGLGFEAALHLLRLNASKVILAVRDATKGEAAAERLFQSSGVTKNAVEVWPLDMANGESVESFARRANELERLDAVILNAAVLTKTWKVANGIEYTLSVNVVNTTLLALQLLPKLRTSAKKYNARGRLAFVGSEAMYMATLSEANSQGSLLDTLNNEKLSEMGERYPNSKLLLLYAVRELAARSPVTPESNVILDIVTPNLCRTKLFREEKPWLLALAQKISFAILARSGEAGGATLVDAVRPDLPLEAHGAFLMDCKVTDDGKSCFDGEKGRLLQARFVGELFEKLEHLSPGCTRAI